MVNWYQRVELPWLWTLVLPAQSVSVVSHAVMVCVTCMRPVYMYIANLIYQVFIRPHHGARLPSPSLPYYVQHTYQILVQTAHSPLTCIQIKNLLFAFLSQINDLSPVICHRWMTSHLLPLTE